MSSKYLQYAAVLHELVLYYISPPRTWREPSTDPLHAFTCKHFEIFQMKGIEICILYITIPFTRV